MFLGIRLLGSVNRLLKQILLEGSVLTEVVLGTPANSSLGNIMPWQFKVQAAHSVAEPAYSVNICSSQYCVNTFPTRLAPTHIILIKCWFDLAVSFYLCTARIEPQLGLCLF